MSGLCHCVNVGMGTHENTVSMKAPGVERNGGWVAIDTCIATEIGWLWHQGVITRGSCCGHGVAMASVVVDPGSERTMELLGYRREVNGAGVPEYRLGYTKPRGDGSDA